MSETFSGNAHLPRPINSAVTSAERGVPVPFTAADSVTRESRDACDGSVDDRQ